MERIKILREKAIKDYVTNIEGAREEGEEKGRKEGIKEGIKEGKIEGKKEEKISIAKKLIKEDVEIRTIAIVTGLTEEQINEIAEGKE